jgi:hypothetical protein
VEASPFYFIVKVTPETNLATPLPELPAVADSPLVQVPELESQAKQVAVISVTAPEPEDHSLALQETSPAGQITSEVAVESLSGIVSFILPPLDSLAKVATQE